MMSNNPQENPPELVKGNITVAATSWKAIFVVFWNGLGRWVTRSIIHNEYDVSNLEEEQEFEIEYWWCKKNDF